MGTCVACLEESSWSAREKGSLPNLDPRDPNLGGLKDSSANATQRYHPSQPPARITALALVLSLPPQHLS